MAASRTRYRVRDGSDRITVYLNGRRLTRYRGMRVRHLLAAEQARQVETGEAEIRSTGNHVVGLDGALSNGQRLFWALTEPQGSTDDCIACGN